MLTWLVTEAKRTGQQELVLGENLAEHMRQLSLTPTGGKKGEITRLRNQMSRLFKARITVDYHGDPNVALQRQVVSDRAS